MAISQQQRTDLLTLTVGLFDAAPSSPLLGGLADGIEAGATIDQYATTMGKSAEFSAIYAPELTNEEFASAFIANLLGADAAADITSEGTTVVLDALADGKSKGQAAYAAVQLLASTEDARYADAQATLENKVAVANTFASSTQYDGATIAQMGEVLENVDSSIESVTQANAAIIRGDIIDVADGGNGGDTGAFTNTIILGEGTNNPPGTDENDLFVAGPGEYQGHTFNTLTSADELDGGAGFDGLHARVTPEQFGQTADEYTYTSIAPTTNSIEEILFNARATGRDAENDVTVDALDMYGVQRIGSDHSRGDLLIDNVNTMVDISTGESVIRNTEALTVVMAHTASGRSVTDETGYKQVQGASDLTVYFNEDFLTAGQTTQGAGLVINVLNAVSNATGGNPVEGVDSISFNVGDQEVVVDVTSVASNASLTFANAYAEVVNLINAQLQSQGITTVAAEIDQTKESVFSIDIDGFSTGDSAGLYYPIFLTNSGSEALVPGKVAQSADSGNNDINASYSSTDATTTNGRVTVNVELLKVGEDGDGGNLVIGAKDETAADTDVDQKDGIEVFNIDVQGSDDFPSNLGKITSTNRSLAVVNVEDGSNWSGADLTVRNLLGQGQELEKIDATDFSGDFSLAMSDANGQQAVVSNFGSGNDSYQWSSSEADKVDSDNAYSINMGAGDDTVIANLDGDSVDALGESFAIITGAGEDNVTVNMTAGVSYATMEELSNLNIDTGAGDDTIKVNDYGTFNVVAGAGSDFIEFDVNDATANNGTWNVFANTGADTFERVLYNAQVTVSFAGFEQTVDIQTNASGNFIATQELINTEIVRAIEANPELSKLLTTKLQSGNQQLNITSNVGGDNTLAISVFQPQLTENATTTDGQVQIGSGDVSALRVGLLATETVAGLSNSLENAAEIAGWTQTNNWEGSVNQQGEGDSITNYSTAQQTADTAEGFANGDDGADIFDATAGVGVNGNGHQTGFLEYNNGGSSVDAGNVSYATVDAGPGSNDIIVLDSNVNSQQTIKVSGLFGKVSVVNFFDSSTDAVAANASSVGEHALDFSEFLTDKVDASTNISGNTDSAVLEDVQLNIITGAAGYNAQVHGAIVDNVLSANEVGVMRFDSGTANQDFDGLTGTNVLAALNGTGANTYGNLTNGLIEAGVAGNSATLVGTTQNHILMIENDLNEGEYKVFHLTSTVTTGGVVTNGDFTTVTELGTMDFGASINLNLRGNAAFEQALAQNIAAQQDVVDSTSSSGDVSIELYLEGAKQVQVVGATDYTVDSVTDVGGITTVTVDVNDDKHSEDFAFAATDSVLRVNTNQTATLSLAVAGSVADLAGAGTINVEDTLANLVTMAKDGSASNKTVLADTDVDAFVATGLASGNQEVSFNNVSANSAATEIDFTSDSVTLTQAEWVAIGLDDNADNALTVTGVTVATGDFVESAAIGALEANDTIAFNGAAATLSESNFLNVFGASSANVSATATDVITVTNVTVGNLADVVEALSNNDVIAFDGGSESLTGAEYNAAFTTAGVAATAGDDITVSSLDGLTVAATVANDTFNLAGSDSSVSITGFTSADDTVALGGINAAVAGTVAELADGDDDETLVFDTAANLGTDAANIGTGGGTTVNWAVASDTGAIYFDADGDWSAGVVAVGTVTADSLVATDFTV